MQLNQFKKLFKIIMIKYCYHVCNIRKINIRLFQIHIYNPQNVFYFTINNTYSDLSYNNYLFFMFFRKKRDMLYHHCFLKSC